MKALFYDDNLADFYPGHIFGEIYKEKVYEGYLNGKNDLIIVDVGGNAGWTTNYFASFAKRVITVEPSGGHCDLIRQLIDYNRLSNVTLIQAAVSNKPGEMKLRHSQNKTMYSLSENPLLPGDEKQGFEKVRVMTLEEIMQQQNLDHIDLLKLDPEGEEANILCSDSFKRIAGKIDTIIFEWHVWCNRNPNQIRTCLRDLGFSWGQVGSDANVYVCNKIK